MKKEMTKRQEKVLENTDKLLDELTTLALEKVKKEKNYDLIERIAPVIIFHFDNGEEDNELNFVFPFNDRDRIDSMEVILENFARSFAPIRDGSSHISDKPLILDMVTYFSTGICVQTEGEGEKETLLEEKAIVAMSINSEGDTFVQTSVIKSAFDESLGVVPSVFKVRDIKYAAKSMKKKKEENPLAAFWIMYKKAEKEYGKLSIKGKSMWMDTALLWMEVATKDN